MVKRSNGSGARNANVRRSQPRTTLVLEDIKTVQLIERSTGEKVCRFNLRDGTWTEIISTGVISATTSFEGQAIINRSSFDFKKERIR